MNTKRPSARSIRVHPTPVQVAPGPMSHSRHVCWWSRNRLCELRNESGSGLSGMGIDLFILEAACAALPGGLILEPKDEQNVKIRIVLDAETITGSIHDDCIIHLERVPVRLTEAIVQAAIEQQLLRHAGLRVDLRDIAPALAEALRDRGSLRLRTNPAEPEIVLEFLKPTWPFGRKRFRPEGKVRFVDGRPLLDRPGQVVLAT